MRVSDVCECDVINAAYPIKHDFNMAFRAEYLLIKLYETQQKFSDF